MLPLSVFAAEPTPSHILCGGITKDALFERLERSPEARAKVVKYLFTIFSDPGRCPLDDTYRYELAHFILETAIERGLTDIRPEITVFHELGVAAELLGQNMQNSHKKSVALGFCVLFNRPRVFEEKIESRKHQMVLYNVTRHMLDLGLEIREEHMDNLKSFITFEPYKTFPEKNPRLHFRMIYAITFDIEDSDLIGDSCFTQ